MYASIADVIVKKFLPKIQMCLSSGFARLRADQPVFHNNHRAVDIAACILSERGFETSVVFDMEHIPTQVADFGKIEYTSKEIVYFEVRFPRGRR